MIRFAALSAAVLAFAFSACERHPLPGETAITHTHGADGPGDSHAAAPHAAAAKHDEKKPGHAPAAVHEDAPKFFPGKK